MQYVKPFLKSICRQTNRIVERFQILSIKSSCKYDTTRRYTEMSLCARPPVDRGG